MAQFTGVAYTYNGSATSNYTYFVDYTYTQNVNTNQSTITAKTYLRSKGSGVSTVSSQWKSIINGTQVWSGSATVSGNNVSFGTKTWTVNHNSDGTGRTEIHASFSNGIAFQDSYVVKSGKLDVAINLPTIPRTSSFSLNTTSPTLGQTSVVVTINRASSSFTHKVRLDYGKTSTVLSSNAGTSYTFTPSLNLASETPSATSGVGNLVVQTYNGSTYIGESVRQITMNIPSTVVPTFTSIAIKGNNLLGGYYVAGKSTATITLGGAGGTYGSSVNGYEIKSNVGNYNSSSSSYTTPTLGATDSLTFTGRVKDTRNRWSSTRTTSPAVKVYSYRVPTVSLSIVRTDETGTPSDEGVYAKIDINYNIDPIVSGTTINAKKYTVNWREVGGDWVNWNINDVSLPNYSGTIQAPFVTGWAINKSYEVRVILSDSFTTVTSTGTIPTGFCILDIEEIGIGVGKYHQKGALDIKGDVYTDSGVYAEKIIKSKVDLITERHGVTSYFTCSVDNGGSTLIKNSLGGALLLGADSGIRFQNKSGTIYTIYHSGNYTPPTVPSNLFTPKMLQNYNGITVNGNDGGFVRTPVSGILPYKSGENGSLGSSAWRFWDCYVRNGNIHYLFDVQTINTIRMMGISGNWWNCFNVVQSNGVTETGKYLDFHDTNGTTADYNARITQSGSDLVSSRNWVSTSDKNLKEDIRYVNGTRTYRTGGYKNFIKNLYKPAIYKFKNSPDYCLGIVAQDFLGTDGEIAIKTFEQYDKETNQEVERLGLDGIAYTTLIGLALQEVITEKDNQINNLEKRVQQLEKEMMNIKKHLKI